MSTSHSIAANDFLKKSENAKWHNETLWGVRNKRDNMSKGVPEWELLRERAENYKLHTISNLHRYLEIFEQNALKNGVTVHWAKDAADHNKIVLDILQKHNAKKLVKSKSMLTEECMLNPYLIKHGIEVVESDLGERILQLQGTDPSHIVMPAIHMKREEVGALFERTIGTEKGNSDPTYLTRAARASLRSDFLSADASMTGVNFGVAATGEVVVCTNEGNADMGTSLTNLHIASMGLEKIVPDYESLAVFIRLLARSATGQPITSYTAHYRKPIHGGELHFVIVDNGRSDILSKKDYVKTLNCIRCGACMNTCPVYRRSGGYSYSYFIPGPIGINLGMLKDPVKYSGNLSACSLCYSCNNVCPVKIDLADQIYKWRQELDSIGKASTAKKVISHGLKFVFTHPKLYNLGLKFAPLAKYLPASYIYGLKQWTKGRDIPSFSSESFTEMWKKGKVKTKK